MENSNANILVKSVVTKPAAVPLAVILLITAALLIGDSFATDKETGEDTLIDNKKIIGRR
ncbi:hypothetical protein [Niastella populi]|uniref:Uncharacterized protein n=1 Tax=Niastella populi TaxID=550983 RepID=A0A1V9EKV7_9BACT|nr:hypothetical protein [Niastella populi]OQP46778.1 hypothetical protein A4R26_08700 [Niastella populi]